MSTTELAVLDTVRAYLGDERIGNPEHMADNWVVTQYKDAHVAHPKSFAKTCFGFLVRGTIVEPMDACSGNTDEAYTRLARHSVHAFA